MSLAALLNINEFRTSIKSNEDNEAARKDILIMDVTISITPTYTNEITENPVETGQDVSDHIRRKPLEITVNGEVSESPLDLDNLLSSAAGLAGAAVGQVAGGFAPLLASAGASKLTANLLKSKDENGNVVSNPAQSARTILEGMIENKSIFSLNTKEKLYKNLSMTSLSFPKDQSTGHKLSFQFTARELRFVSSETRKLTAIETKAAHGGPKQKLGNQTSEKLNSKDSSNGSIIYKLFKGG